MVTDPVTLFPVGEPKYFKTVKVYQGARQEMAFNLTDTEGNALNLGTSEVVQPSKCDAVENGIDSNKPEFSDGIRPKPMWPDVTIKLVVSKGYGEVPEFTVEGVILDHQTGSVAFTVIEDQTVNCGIYLAEIGLFRGDHLLKAWPLYISIEPSLFATTQPDKHRGVITIPEIRLALRDLDPSYNDLLDDLEFKDAEILHCIRQPVEFWNETLPFEPVFQFTLDRFPFRYNWLRATSGYLLELAAHWYRRNDLPTQAGGVSVRDRNKHETYEPKAKQLIQEYQDWAKRRKYAESMSLAWGAVRSAWPYAAGWR